MNMSVMLRRRLPRTMRTLREDSGNVPDRRCLLLGKLESLEAGDGWFRPEKGELPPDAGTVIAIVSGSPANGVALTGSYQTASYFANNPADWVIDEWLSGKILQCIAGSRHRKPGGSQEENPGDLG